MLTGIGNCTKLMLTGNGNCKKMQFPYLKYIHNYTIHIQGFQIKLVFIFRISRKNGKDKIIAEIYNFVRDTLGPSFKPAFSWYLYLCMLDLCTNESFRFVDRKSNETNNCGSANFWTPLPKPFFDMQCIPYGTEWSKTYDLDKKKIKKKSFQQSQGSFSSVDDFNLHNACFI